MRIEELILDGRSGRTADCAHPRLTNSIYWDRLQVVPRTDNDHRQVLYRCLWMMNDQVADLRLTSGLPAGWDPSFNAITGLNGSGKSNILDAVCFVLGITNMTQVRGEPAPEPLKRIF